MSRTDKEGKIANVFNLSKYLEFCELNDLLASFILYIVHIFYWRKYDRKGKKGTSTGMSIS